MRQLIEWAREMREPSEFLSTLKVDLYPEEVYIFTPKGKVLALPRGATPVDFAYSIHTEVGHQCVGAKVNGQMVPLRHTLANGDVVEILTQSGHGPSRDWLTFVQTSRARSKIRQWVNLNERQQATDVGRRLIEKEARQQGLSLKKLTEEDLLRVAADYGRAKAEDLYADLGYGKYSARQVVAKLTGKAVEEKPDAPAEPPPLVSRVKRILGIRDPGILVLGQDNLMVYRAKCCNPIPGESITGYVTRGKGVSVHSAQCPNLLKLMVDPERRVEVSWQGEKDAKYDITLSVNVEDRKGILADITSIIADMNTDIRTIEAKTFEDRKGAIDVTVSISNVKELDRIARSIRSVEGVLDVARPGMR
jgi:GTP pyrophosphokinase